MLETWDGRHVQAVRSKGGTIALAHYRDGLLCDGITPWPPPEIAQKLYASKQLDHFPSSTHTILTGDLGFYCDLQSVNSEDVFTWNVFGTISHADADSQNRFANSFMANLGISEPSVSPSRTWVWRRLPHPDTLGSGGPELDFAVMTRHSLVIGESKWHGSLSHGQGTGKDLDQIQVRQKFLERIGERMFPEVRNFLVVGLSIEGDLIQDERIEQGGKSFALVNMTWDQLVSRVIHPRSKALRDYLAWKKLHGGRMRSSVELVDRLEIKPASRTVVLGAPAGWCEQITPEPETIVSTDPVPGADTVILFVRDEEALMRNLARAEKLFRKGGKLWISWPLRQGRLRSDLTRNKVLAACRKLGLVNVKNARIDGEWTAIKFYRRQKAER